MGITEGVKGTFDWSVAGLEKLNAMEQRLASLESHMETRLPAAARHAEGATAKLGQSHAVSGEKLARYGTSVGMLTGQMQGLGIQNELVTRGIQIGAEAMTGMLGPVGMVTIAIGGLAAGIAFLVNKHRENEKAINDSTAAMQTNIEKIKLLAAYGDPSGLAARVLIGMTGPDLESKLAELQAESLALYSEMTVGGKMVTDYREDAMGNMVSFQKFQEFSTGELAKIKLKAVETGMAVLTVRDAIGKLNEEYRGEPQGPYPDELYAGQLGSAIKDIRAPGLPLTALSVPEMGGGSSRGKPGGAIDITTPGKDIPQVSIYKQMEDAGISTYEMLTMAGTKSADAQVAAMQYVFSTHARGYAAMSALTQSTQKASSMFVQRAMEGENVHRLKGLAVARYVASGAAAAVIRGLGQEAEKHAAMEVAKALASWPDPVGMVRHAAAAAAFGAMAGGAAGVAAGMESTAQRQFDRETTRSGQSSGTAAGNGAGGAVSSSNPGVRIAASGASVGTVNYNFIVTYQGATVYGDGGTRDWFYRELVPLINEGLSVGSISTN